MSNPKPTERDMEQAREWLEEVIGKPLMPTRATPSLATFIASMRQARTDEVKRIVCAVMDEQLALGNTETVEVLAKTKHRLEAL